jgi:predicted patatin/cPLA2 family phospholipase
LKLGLVDVGGGLRGIFAAGVLDYCIDKGIEFDCCIGVSAGSANVASYMAGQRKRNYYFYTVYPFRKEYMSLNNFLHKGSYLDMDYIYGVMSNSDGENPLDYDRFTANHAEMYVVATDAMTGKPVYFTKDDMYRNDYDILKASSSIPGVCKPYRIGEHLYFDGALSDPVPVQKALDCGCDKTVIILTKPRDTIRSEKDNEKLVKMISGKYPEAAKNFRLRAFRYNESVKFAKKLESQGKTLIIAPDDLKGVSTLSKNKMALDRFYNMGYRKGKSISEYISK